MGNFPKAIADYCVRICEKYNIPMISAIDCGAGPGGMAIRLAEKFSKVEAFDLGEGFVEMATAKVQELKITNLKVY